MRAFVFAIAGTILLSLPSRAQFYINILGYRADTLYTKLNDASDAEKNAFIQPACFLPFLIDC
jgi:hypothetical protein